jgi:hypothetical protein
MLCSVLQIANNLCVHLNQMKNGGIMLTDLTTISGYCYRDMPVAGIYDAAALHLDLNMLESLGTCKCISLIAPELIREGNAFAKKRERRQCFQTAGCVVSINWDHYS